MNKHFYYSGMDSSALSLSLASKKGMGDFSWHGALVYVPFIAIGRRRIVGPFLQTFSAPFLNVAPGPRNTENTFQFVLKRSNRSVQAQFQNSPFLWGKIVKIHIS